MPYANTSRIARLQFRTEEQIHAFKAAGAPTTLAAGWSQHSGRRTMKRRRFLQLFGGVSLAGLPGLRLAGQRRRIGVIGGGIIGASIGYHLAHRGAEVTLFERERPGSGATGNSFAWINAGYSKRPWEYFYLNRLGMEAYRYLDQQLGGALHVQWGGSLQWHADAERAQRLRGNVRTHQKWGYPVHLVSETQFANLAPNIAPGPVLAAAHAEQEAAIDPVHVTEALLTEAEKAGLTIEVPCEVNGLDIQWGRLRGVTTSKGPIELDTLVIAAGVDTPRLAEKAGIKVPLRDSPGILAHTTPQPRLLERLAVALAPAGHLKQKPDGRVVTGLTFDGTPGLEPTREQGERQPADGRAVCPSAQGCRARAGHTRMASHAPGWLPDRRLPGRRSRYLHRGDAQRGDDGGADGPPRRPRDPRRRACRDARAVQAVTLRRLVHRRPDSVKLSGSPRAQAQGAATSHTGSMSRRGKAHSTFAQPP